MRVVVVACHDNGDIDLEDLRSQKVGEHGDRLSTLMITLSSTHGRHQDEIAELCAVVHDAGGQVYVDGANLDALIGLARPGKFGGDVSHLNLHRDVLHSARGRGPGVGPVAVRSHSTPVPSGTPVCSRELARSSGVIERPLWISASITPMSGPISG